MHFQSQNLPFQFVGRQARIMSTLAPLSDPRDDTHISLAQTKTWSVGDESTNFYPR